MARHKPVPGNQQISKAEAVSRLRDNATAESDPRLAAKLTKLADQVNSGEGLFKYEWTDSPTLPNS